MIIVLDLDDTLYLERDYVRSGIAAVGQEVLARWGVADFGTVAQELWDGGQRTRLFDVALTKAGLVGDRATVERLVACYRAHLPEIALAPDADIFLERPPADAMALVTDGHLDVQRRKIAALGLERFEIDPMICTDVWGRACWKPHRRGFEAVVAQHGRQQRYVYVADNPAKDFLGPRALGWSTVQIDREGAVHPRSAPGDRHGADIRITSLTELTADRLVEVEHACTAPVG